MTESEQITTNSELIFKIKEQLDEMVNIIETMANKIIDLERKENERTN